VKLNYEGVSHVINVNTPSRTKKASDNIVMELPVSSFNYCEVTCYYRRVLCEQARKMKNEMKSIASIRYDSVLRDRVVA